MDAEILLDISKSLCAYLQGEILNQGGVATGLTVISKLPSPTQPWSPAVSPKKERKPGTLLRRLIPQFLHDWFPLHYFLVCLGCEMLLDPALTKLVSRPWIEIHFRPRVHHTERRDQKLITASQSRGV